MVDAWDEFSRDENETGWTSAVNAAKAKYKEVRIIPLTCDMGKLKAAFETPPISADVAV